MASADVHASDGDVTPGVDDARRDQSIGRHNDAVAAAQAIMAGVAPADLLISDELIAERRAEAVRE
jgi:hypothetical protein